MSKKKPIKNVNPNGKKNPTNKTNPDNWKMKTPVWVFSRHDEHHEKWSLTVCENIYNEVLTKLMSFEGMTWDEINRQTHDHGKSSNHFLKISILTKEAQKRIQELHIYEDEIYSLRLNNKKRLFGIINDNKFSIIWYDQEHEVYPYDKKHT